MAMVRREAGWLLGVLAVVTLAMTLQMAGGVGGEGPQFDARRTVFRYAETYPAHSAAFQFVIRPAPNCVTLESQIHGSNGKGQLARSSPVAFGPYSQLLAVVKESAEWFDVEQPLSEEKRQWLRGYPELHMEVDGRKWAPIWHSRRDFSRCQRYLWCRSFLGDEVRALEATLYGPSHVPPRMEVLCR